MPKGTKGRPPATCHPDREHYGKGLCKPCYQNWWFRNNPDRAKMHRKKQQPKANERQRKYRKLDPLRYKNTTLKYLYGLSIEDRSALIQKQKGKCGICGEQLWEALYIDHCHETKRVRGMLCSRCNPGIGFLDTTKKLEAAIEYLQRNS